MPSSQLEGRPQGAGGRCMQHTPNTPPVTSPPNTRLPPNESGIHKGTAPNFNDRIIFRYIFKKK